MTDRPGSLSRADQDRAGGLVTVAWLLPVYWLVNVALKTQAQLMVAEADLHLHADVREFRHRRSSNTAFCGTR